MAGASDLFIAWPTDNHHGLWLEMKSAKGKPTKSQQEFLEKMQNKGYATAIAHSWDEAMAVTINYLKN